LTRIKLALASVIQGRIYRCSHVLDWVKLKLAQSLGFIHVNFESNGKLGVDAIKNCRVYANELEPILK